MRRAIQIGGTTVTVEVAQTERSREQGLSGRASLNSNSGMLFVFDTPGQWGIWMKEMRFSLDIIWLDAQGTVVSADERVSPETYPEVFYPTELASFVVELPVGFLAEHGVGVGSRVDFR